jgi:hypothetical protein
MERHKTAASYALPLFAMLWLAAILTADLLPPGYTLNVSRSWNGPNAVVTGVGPDLAKAGLRVGDRLAYDRTSYVRNFGAEGTIVTVHVLRGTQTLVLRAPLTKRLQPPAPLARILNDVCITIALLLATYLGFRKPSVMIAALILFLGGAELNWTTFVNHFSALPDGLYVPFASLMVVLCDWFPVVALASFAVRLPGSAPAAGQRTAIRIVDVIVIATFFSALLLTASNLYRIWYNPLTVFSGVLLLLASIAALAFARPADRGRAGIVFAGVMIGGVGYAANMIGLSLNEPYWLFIVYANISALVVPFSLAYAILRHRVFDVAFVLNRTIVFALTSALVIVVFAALEFGAERFLSDVTHVEGVILQFGIALAVIVSVRQLNRRVDLVVDNVLFRARHEQERALRRFASTLQFYTDEAALVRDTVDVLLRYGRVHGAAVYLAGETGMRRVRSSFPVATAEIDHNDMAYVEMRAHHEPLAIRAMPTALPGDRLYPMIRAGRMAGVVATGERESGEEMPPDIDDAIKAIAHAAATSLGAIESDHIRSELTTLRAHLGFP